MPLLTLTGYPASGKSRWAEILKQSLELKIAESSETKGAKASVVIISDESLGISKDEYADARREKAARGLLYSSVERQLGKECIVICDALNYIKGFRYQLSCSAKALGTPHCLVHIGCVIDKCKEFNAHRSGGYSSQTLEELVMRYEEPNAQTKWDAPCFNILWDDSLAPIDQIWEALMLSKIIRPNAATLMRPAVNTDYLYQLDKVTQSVVMSIQDMQRMGVAGGTLQLDGSLIHLPEQSIGVGALQRHRRQFIAINRNLMLDGTDRIQKLFIEFLNDLWR